MLWTENCRTGDSHMIPSILDALGLCKGFTLNLFTLLEETIVHYFAKSWTGRSTDAGSPVLDASWSSGLLQKVGPQTVRGFDEEMLLKNRFLLGLHLLTLARLAEAPSSGEKMIVLQKLYRVLEELKVRLVDQFLGVGVLAKLIYCFLASKMKAS